MTILLTGGSACGKSTYAEELAGKCRGKKIYLACMRPYGEEGQLRIKRHRKMREGRNFITLEKYTDIHEALIPEKSTVLLECLCNLTANEMFDKNGNVNIGVEDKIINGLMHIKAAAQNLIIVTNEVGAGASGCDASVKKYIEALGNINMRAADMADTVIEMVCGIPIVLKGSL